MQLRLAWCCWLFVNICRAAEQNTRMRCRLDHSWKEYDASSWPCHRYQWTWNSFWSLHAQTQPHTRKTDWQCLDFVSVLVKWNQRGWVTTDLWGVRTSDEIYIFVRQFLYFLSWGFLKQWPVATNGSNKGLFSPSQHTAKARSSWRHTAAQESRAGSRQISDLLTNFCSVGRKQSLPLRGRQRSTVFGFWSFEYEFEDETLRVPPSKWTDSPPQRILDHACQAKDQLNSPTLFSFLPTFLSYFMQCFCCLHTQNWCWDWYF